MAKNMARNRECIVINNLETEQDTQSLSRKIGENLYMLIRDFDEKDLTREEILFGKKIKL